MKGEIWKDIEGYEGLYQVSNMGRVKSLERTVWCGLNGGCYKTIPERILKAYDSNKEYLRVCLCKDGKSKQCLVHRLVATAFIPNPTNLPEINHKDENPKNNNVQNLEWCSRSYNTNYGTRNKRAGKKIAEKLRGRKQSEEQVKNRAEKLRGRKQSEEQVKNRAEKLRGRKLSEEQIKNMSKPVIGINKVSGLILEFPSIAEAGRQTGISSSHICACCKGRLKSIGGFAWYYTDTE